MSRRFLFPLTIALLATTGLRADDPVERARAEVESRKERVAWAERMVKMKYLAENQLRAERARLAAAEVALLKAQAGRRKGEPEGGVFDRLTRLALQALVARADIDRARSDLEMARERAAWSVRMVKMGYLTPAQAKADEARAAAAADRLKKATDALKPIEPAKPDER